MEKNIQWLKLNMQPYHGKRGVSMGRIESTSITPADRRLCVLLGLPGAELVLLGLIIDVAGG